MIRQSRFTQRIDQMSFSTPFVSDTSPRFFGFRAEGFESKSPANKKSRFLGLPSMLAMMAAVATMAPAAHAQGDAETQRARQGIAIRPSATDPAIKALDEPHLICVDRDIVVAHKPELPADRHQLLLWIPGTKASPKADAEREGDAAMFPFGRLAAELGYHVVFLRYPNEVSASICHQDPEPSAFEDFRLAIIAGAASKHITVSRTDSIENRLIKLLRRLGQLRPREEWGQFLNNDGSIHWEMLALAGQSQGGGHAALLGVLHPVSRVICFGAPKDYSVALHAPAAWYRKESATPKNRFFAFNHEQDHQACSPEMLLENLRALDLERFGAPMSVDTAAPPYAHARILMTNYPGARVDSATAHTTMISAANERVFGKVWRYMLTE
jgi:pimeloyl-ACP methyl ester carboxylesterase